MEISIEVVPKIEVKYVINDEELVYMDTILFDKEEFEKTDKEALEKQFSEKFAKWKESLSAMKVELTKEQKQAKLDSLVKQAEIIEKEIDTLSVEIVKSINE